MRLSHALLAAFTRVSAPSSIHIIHTQPTVNAYIVASSCRVLPKSTVRCPTVRLRDLCQVLGIMPPCVMAINSSATASSIQPLPQDRLFQPGICCVLATTHVRVAKISLTLGLPWWFTPALLTDLANFPTHTSRALFPFVQK